jgi:hypothetical protein
LSYTTKLTFSLILLSAFFGCSSDQKATSANSESVPVVPVATNSQNTNQPQPQIVETPPPSDTQNSSPLAKVDFRNFTFPLPRGWQDASGEITLTNGLAPLSMEKEDLKLGARYVATKFGDVTGDGQDEAFVIVKLETGGSAFPQVVYVYEWKNEKPERLWYFRTGDRSDGGLKDIRAENSELVIELFGQDRYIFGDVETLKIVGDEFRLCCPNYFTRNRYKLTGGRFVMQGKRLTYSIEDPTAPGVENMGETKLQTPAKKR